MKVHIFGSLSGTEPIGGRHQTSLAIESNGLLYWFDAGENCAHAAFCMGLDLFRMRTLCFTHPHFDHIAGLPHLLWILDKLWKREGRQAHQPLDVFLPTEAFWHKALAFGSFPDPYVFPGQGEVLPHLIQDGVLFDENLTIEARRNNHLPPDNNTGKPCSFSFRVRTEGKTVIISGDVKSFLDFAPWLEEGCDLLLMETGHHGLQNVCDGLSAYPVKHILFYHHGREIMSNFDNLSAAYRSKNIVFAKDHSTYDVN
ncbi:MAG: MBL fold metallo-hydrolase [Victivallales bacterium]|nr:MBL fold metallo-hydrolase [Victivallales bacterium]